MRDIFESKDKDKNGVIDSRELRQCLMAVGFCPSADDIEFLLEHFDNNGNAHTFSNSFGSRLRKVIL